MVFIISFPFFINSCNFFFYWNWKGYVLFSIFSSTSKMLITVRYVLKNYRTFLQYAPLWITYAICSTSIFSCVVTMFANFILKIYLEFCLFKYNKFFAFSYDFCCSFFNKFIFFFEYNYLCCLFSFTKLFHTVFTFVFSMLSNYIIVDIEKLDAICSPTLAVDLFSWLFFYPSIFSIKHLNLHK